MKPRLRVVALAVALGCALYGSAARAQVAADVELQHVGAGSVLPLLRALAAPARLDGSGATIRIKGSGAQLQRVRELVAQADHEPGRLSVLLRDDAPADDGPALAPPPPDNSSTLSTGTPMAPDRQGNGQVLGTAPVPRREGIVEGETLRLSMPATQSLRFRIRAPLASAAAGGKAGADAGGVVYFEGQSDFNVRLWRVGSTVAVQLQLRRAGRVSGSTTREDADEQEPESRVTYGPLGRWFALADSGRPIGPDQAGAPRTGLWLKVEPSAQ